MNTSDPRLQNRREPPLAPKPCPYPAGSEERILCYAERAEAGFTIFHPDDDPFCGAELTARELAAMTRHHS